MTTTAPNSPRVVACLPTWNAESFIVDTLESLAAQTYPNLEVLISDDASTDRTAKICEQFAAVDPRFRIVRQQNRLGWIGNTNALLCIARGDYFFFMGHDDRLKSSFVARLVEALEENPQAILAYSDIDRFYSEGNREYASYVELDGVYRRVERARRVLWQREGWYIPYRGVFRAAATERVEGLKQNLSGDYCADWQWVLRMSLLGEFIRIPEAHYFKFCRVDSLSASWKLGFLTNAAVALSCATEIRRADFSPVEEFSLYLVLVRRFLRRLVQLRHRRTK